MKYYSPIFLQEFYKFIYASSSTLCFDLLIDIDGTGNNEKQVEKTFEI